MATVAGTTINPIAHVKKSGSSLEDVLNRIAATGTTVGQNAQIAGAAQGGQAIASGGVGGSIPQTPEELIAAGYFWDGSQWLPRRAPGSLGGATPQQLAQINAAGAAPHLQTGQSASAGSNLGGGGSIGRPGASRGGVSGGTSVRQDPVAERESPLERMVAQLALEDKARALTPGSAAGIAGVGDTGVPGAPTPVSTSTGVPGAPGGSDSVASATAGGGGGDGSTLIQALLQDQVIHNSNPDALRLLSDLINAGGTEATKTATQNQLQGQGDILATLGALGGLASGQTTAPLTGALQGVARQFREQVFPQIARSAEAGGSSKGALRSLLENDAMARQQEVQSQVALDAQMKAAANQAGLAQALQSLSQQSPLSQELLALLGAGARLPSQEVVPTQSTSIQYRV
jgi:hypothetical protein